MRSKASQIVSFCGSNWIWFGWVLFAGVLLIPFIASRDKSSTPMMVWLVSLILFLTWWFTDILDQEVPAWVVLCGIALIAIGIAGHVGFLIIACWVIYMLRVRE
jgi:hypothetical protein